MAHRSLEDVKDIDTETIHYIFGYVRDVQASFPEDSIYHTIPTLVIHWILLYFAVIEQFDTENCGASYDLSEHNTIVKKTKSCYKTAYLTKIVSKGVHKWRFKAIKMSPYTTIIGVWKTKYATEIDAELWEDYAKGKFYGYSSTHGQLTSGDQDFAWEKCRYGERKCQQGDVIDMILDLNKLEIRYFVNHRDYGVAFENIDDTSYRVCICVHEKKDVLKFVEYQNMSKLTEK